MSLQNKVLRLFIGTDTGEDWHRRNIGYTKDDVANIKDPAAGARKEITSIPSPFARVHLFENAFEAVSVLAKKEGYKSLDQLTAYHQLVSDALDVAEIFLNFEVFNQSDHNLRFVQWNIEKEIAQLKNSPPHRLFGETLDLFLKQDTKKSHFGEISNFYILYCNNQPVGCTSPSTMFFGAHNEGFRLGGLKLGRGNDVFFDDKPLPLYKRTNGIQRYLSMTFQLYPKLKKTMAPLWAYMQENLKALEETDPMSWQALQNSIFNKSEPELKKDFEQEFAQAQSAGENTHIEIIKGVYHRRLKVGGIDLSEEPFAIKSDIYTGKKPLALQKGFSKPLSYCGGNWKPDTEVPYFDERPLDRRILPGTAEAYPYFTVSDFLEPCLIQVPYPLDKEHFIAGNPKGFRDSDRTMGDKGIPGDDAYLLPITRMLFDCYGPDFLGQRTPDGRPHFQMVKKDEDSVEVELLIPIFSGDYIQYRRLYRPGQAANPLKNEGSIVMCRFDIGFFPLFHVNKNVKQFVVLADGDTLPSTKEYDYSLDFYLNNGTNVSPRSTDVFTRQDKHKHKQFVTTKYFVQNNYYDFIQISNGKGQQGIIVPKWKEQPNGTKPTKVAVDFGTTNSFVALSLDSEEPQGLEIKENDRFLVTLSEHWVEVQSKQVILRTLAPLTLGSKEECWLPMRTIISEIQGVNYSQVKPGTLISIPFYFERRSLLKNEDWKTNLKWSKISRTGDPNLVRIESYLSMLLFMARNQIISKGGDLTQCQLVWTYPTSMGESMQGLFHETWQEVAREYLGNDVHVEAVPESLAPFYAFDKNEVKSGQYPVVNIDIGGGTTDAIIFMGKNAEYGTSFRFAGNTLFGSGYADYNSKNNGLLRMFQNSFEQWFDDNQGKLYNLTDVYRGESIGIKNMGAADINSFFFSIEQNKEVVDAGLRPISYSSMLSQREDVKVAFLLFYSAIIYHLAHLMKGLGLDQPRQILFSGKGASIIKLMDTSMNRKNSTELTTLIFNHVYGKDYHNEGLDILIGAAPKEKTCYGAINMVKDKINIVSVKNVVLLQASVDHVSANTKDTTDSAAKPEPSTDTAKTETPNAAKSFDLVLINDKAKDGVEVRYKDLLKEDMLAATETEVRRFLEFFFKLSEQYSFAKKFGALTGESLLKCKQILERDLRDSLQSGLDVRRDTVDVSEHVGDPLFFYPLVGSIHALLNHFAENSNTQR